MCDHVLKVAIRRWQSMAMNKIIVSDAVVAHPHHSAFMCTASHWNSVLVPFYIELGELTPRKESFPVDLLHHLVSQVQTGISKNGNIENHTAYR